MAGTTEEIKQVVMKCLRAVYPRGRSGSYISITCFKGKTGADGELLIGFGEGTHLNSALDELVAKGKIISNDQQGDTIYHYKTDAPPPAVSLMDEVKLAIAECLYRTYPRELTHAGIAQEWFNDEYGEPLRAANWRILGKSADRAQVQNALEELVVEGKIDAYEKERDGERMVHYRAKESVL